MAESNENVNRKAIEDLIDKKISDAKLVGEERRLSLILKFGAALLVVFGIILPLLLFYQSSYRVDRAIDEMKANFKELAGFLI